MAPWLPSAADEESEMRMPWPMVPLNPNDDTPVALRVLVLAEESAVVSVAVRLLRR